MDSCLSYGYQCEINAHFWLKFELNLPVTLRGDNYHNPHNPLNITLNIDIDDIHMIGVYSFTYSPVHTSPRSLERKYVYFLFPICKFLYLLYLDVSTLQYASRIVPSDDDRGFCIIRRDGQYSLRILLYYILETILWLAFRVCCDIYISYAVKTAGTMTNTDRNLNSFSIVSFKMGEKRHVCLDRFSISVH